MKDPGDEELSDSDCCGSGCNPCILDVRKRLSEQKQHVPDNNVLDQSNYVKFVVHSVKESAGEYLIFILKLKEEVKNDCGILIKLGQYIIIHTSNISRPFTPISWDDETITILVKIYEGGIMSELLKKKTIGNEINVRGPYGDFSYKRNSVGSGIAVMYPIINSIILDNLEDTRLSLNSSFRYFSTVPFKDELRRLTDYWNFSCTIFLTHENQEENNVLSGVKLVSNVRINEQIIKDCLDNSPVITTLVLICGTKSFNEMAQMAVKKYNYMNYYIFE